VPVKTIGIGSNRKTIINCHQKHKLVSETYKLRGKTTKTGNLESDFSLRKAPLIRGVLHHPLLRLNKIVK